MTDTTDTVRVKPRHGLILAGVPIGGADLPRALAEEWIADRLVVAVPTPSIEAKPRPYVRRTKPQGKRRNK